MGQAKARGNYEDRRSKAIERQEAAMRARKERQAKESVNPIGRGRRSPALNALLVAGAIGSMLRR